MTVVSLDDAMELATKMVEVTADIVEIKMRAELAEVRLKGAEERCQLLLEAKNMWMNRALAAEKQLAGKTETHL